MGKGDKGSGAAASASSDPRPLRRSLAALLTPYVDAEALGLTAVDVTPTQPNFLLRVDGFLTPEECVKLIHAAESADVALQPPNGADLHPKKGEALLNRDAAAVVDPELSQALWARLRPLLPDVDGRVPLALVGDGKLGRAVPDQLKFYRYQKGHSFGLHVDVSRKGPNAGEETEYTLLMYLNSVGAAVRSDAAALEGGATVFMATAKQELCRVEPQQGMALLHAHGRRCLLHEAALVTKGVKFVLRADVMYGPPAAEGGQASAQGRKRAV